MHVKNIEKPTFLILNDDSNLRTALSETRVNSLKFEHLSNKKKKNDTLIGARYIPQCGDLIDAKKHTLNDLISASNIPLYTLT